MDKHLEERFVSGETIYDGKVVHLEKWTVSLPNGHHATREVIRHVGASAVLAVSEAGEAFLVRQWRAPLSRITLELPAGKLDQRGADPLLAAKRELSEETGLCAQDWHHLGGIYTTVGFCDERIDLYLARGLSQEAAHPDDDEFVEIQTMPYNALYELAIAGKIEDAKTLAAVLMAHPLLSQG